MTQRSPDHAVLERALHHARVYLDGLEESSVAATATKEQLRSRLARTLGEEGVDPVRVIDDLVSDTAGGLLGSTGGRFFAWVIGGTLPTALAADWLTSTWDQNAALYACGPAEAVIEEVCGAWLKDLLGLPDSASFALVTGCQMSHFTCLAAARHRLLASAGWDVERKGLSGAPQIRLLTTSRRHGSIERAIRLLGLGSECIIELPMDDRGRLTAEALAVGLESHTGAPMIVLLQAGDQYGRVRSLPRADPPGPRACGMGPCRRGFRPLGERKPAVQVAAAWCAGRGLVEHGRPQMAERSVRLRLCVRGGFRSARGLDVLSGELPHARP
jgi:hypothetical protein